MENYFNNYHLGDRFYDSYNDRYITIDSMSIGSRTVCGYVEEYDVDLEDYAVSGRFNFHMRELNKFKRLEV